MTEYLYDRRNKHRIVKRTEKYYQYVEETKRTIHRDRVDEAGEMWESASPIHWWRDVSLVKKFSTKPPPPPKPKPRAKSLRTLKKEMVAAHPDKGGTNTAFIAARRAYVEARRRRAP
jgi:hypothetical protein